MESVTTDGKLHWVVYDNEEDHPLNRKDPRNQFVQYFNKFKDLDGQPKPYAFNKTKPFFQTAYKKGFSPPKSKHALRFRPPNRSTVGLIA